MVVCILFVMEGVLQIHHDGKTIRVPSHSVTSKWLQARFRLSKCPVGLCNLSKNIEYPFITHGDGKLAHRTLSQLLLLTNEEELLHIIPEQQQSLLQEETLPLEKTRRIEKEAEKAMREEEVDFAMHFRAWDYDDHVEVLFTMGLHFDYKNNNTISLHAPSGFRARTFRLNFGHAAAAAIKKQPLPDYSVSTHTKRRDDIMSSTSSSAKLTILEKDQHGVMLLLETCGGYPMCDPHTDISITIKH